MTRDDGDNAPSPARPAGESEAAATDEAPPILGSWSRLYAVVLLVELAILALLYFFTKYFE